LKSIRIISIIFIFLFAACTRKTSSPIEYKGRQLIIGNGGGFTGTVNRYFITDKGDLFQGGKDDTSFVKVGTIDKKVIGQYFANYDNLNMKDLSMDEPGNRYYFVILKDKDGKEHKAQWGADELKDKTIAIFYDNIMKSIKKTDSLNKVKKEASNQK
jgi:hypothetical protein